MGDFDALKDEDFPPLPPPHSPAGGGAETEGGDAEEGEVSKLADVPAAKRKVAKRPQPKLDSQRLVSERGLPALRTLFHDARFKGKGHEAEDLRLLMQRMENWAHRLYPKLQFEDFIERVEKLGSKKEVQTCLKRIRLDMPLTNEDFMDQGGEEPPPDPDPYPDPDPFGSQTSFSDPPGPIHSTPAPAAPLPPPPPPSLTEEQRLRMEQNRQRALERRLARQQQQQQTDSQNATAPPSGTDPTSVSTETFLGGSAEQLEGTDRSGSSEPPILNGSAEQEENPGEPQNPEPPSSTEPPAEDEENP